MTTIIILTAIIVALIVVNIWQSASSLRRIAELDSRANDSARQLNEADLRINDTTRRAEEAERHARETAERLRQSEDTNSSLRENLARAEERLRLLDAEKAERDRVEEERFRNLANEILLNNSRRFKQEHETRLDEILAPLKNDIATFKKKVEETYSAEARERFSLSERIKELIDANQSIGREAKELTEALRGNSKVQGDWGELVLQTILDKSGLREGVHYTVQQTTDESGRALRNDDGSLLRPDVVINYPDGRCMVIDSKVSLSAFVRYTKAETDEERQTEGQRHVASVRNHIEELRRKSYQDYVGDNKTDFVMMFIPNEPAYIAAMRLDDNLWQEAYDKRVLIISPTHLISALRIVAQLWNHDRQTRNAIEIAETAGRMYDKLVGFLDDMQRIEKALSQAVDAHSAAMKKLSEGTGNLIGRAEKMKSLGAKASKIIDRRLVKDDEHQPHPELPE